MSAWRCTFQDNGESPESALDARANATRRIDLGHSRELLQKGRAVITVDGVEILVLRTARRLYAVVNVCPHLGWPLDNGQVSRKKLRCAGHGIRYDLRSGCVVSPLSRRSEGIAPLEMLPVEIRDGHVFLTVPEGSPAAPPHD